MARYFVCVFSDFERNVLSDMLNNKYDEDEYYYGLDKDTIWRLRLISLKSIISGNFFEVNGVSMALNPIRDYKSQDRKNYRFTEQYITIEAITPISVYVSIADSEYDKLMECRKTLYDSYYRRIFDEEEDINKYDALKYTYIDGLKYIFRLRKEQEKDKEGKNT